MTPVDCVRLEWIFGSRSRPDCDRRLIGSVYGAVVFPVSPSKSRSGDSHGRAIASALCVAALLPFIDAIVKLLTRDYSIVQLVWVRLALGCLLVGVGLTRTPVSMFRPNAMGLQCLRGLCSLLAMLLLYQGFGTLPLAECTAIVFVAPVLANLFSRIWLGEGGDPLSWWLGALSFIGVLIVARPGGAMFTSAALYPAFGAIALAAYMTLTRAVAARDSARVTAFFGPFVGLVLVSLWMPVVWVPPQSATHLLLFGGIGLIAAASQLLQALTFRLRSTHVVAPFSYASLLVSVALGYWVFGALPDAASMVGMAIIVGAGLLMALQLRIRTPRTIMQSNR